MKWLLPCVLLAGCHAPPPPPPSVADLRFPVVVLFGESSVVAYPDATALSTMRIGNLNTITGPPPLIDSQFAVYRLTKLGSTHNDLWLMMHPTGSTPVTFTLERAPQSGLEAARALLGHYLETQTWRRDLEQKRRALAAERTLPGMLTIVQGEDK
ncbi:MAG: hypothetical protein P4L99_08730 [Chthoniobacter sp.]|nr:hypothetical protein [Chthoniobacter sp.]